MAQKHIIPFQWAQYRNGEIVYDAEAQVTLTDQQLMHVAEYIRKGYNSCMVEDLPDGIYDMFEENDEFAPQMDLPLPLLRLLPKKVLALLDSEDLFAFYEVGSWDELFAQYLD